MNATNRGVNRTILFVCGLVLLAAGAVMAAVMLWPAGGGVWRAAASSAVDWMRAADQSSRLSEATTVSWLAVVLLAVLVLIVVVAGVVIVRLGGGRSSAVIHEDAGDGPQGSVTIRHGFASDAISHSLASHQEILSSRVEARRVRGTDVLHVSVTPRQNTSPVAVAETVTVLVDNLATLTGRQTPTFVSIRSGIRSRLAADQSRVS